LLRTWKKMPKVENMPNITIHYAMANPNVTYIRWKVHGDWVTQLNYYDSMKAIISSSNHEPTALVIGDSYVSFTIDPTELKEHFLDNNSNCHSNTYFVPGTVQTYIISHLHIKPTDKCRNRSSEKFNYFLEVIWDLETYSCLFTASSKVSGIKGDLTACLYLPEPQALCVATNAVALLHLRLRPAPEPHLVLSHQDPVVCCKYNPAFRHVVSCSEASNHGHKEDILCVVQCPPFLLATSSYDGEIIIWNVISGHVCCKLNTPSPSNVPDPRKDQSVSCLAFLKTRAAKLDTTAASLVANGPGGSVTFWRLFGVTGLFANFTPSRGKAQVSSIAVTAGDALVYLADQQGFVHIYDIKEYGLWGPELQPPKRTFGQSNPWDIFTPSSWSHPRVPYEILTDPQSMPTHPTLEGETPAGCPAGREKPDDVTEEKTWAEPGKSSNLCSPENLILEVEKKEEMNQWSEFPHGRLLTAQNKPCWKSPEPGWPSIYQTLRCHEIASVSALGEKPDLSIIGSDLLNVNFLMQEEEASGATQDS
ncbi:hypothetical protein H920_05251, partial [Fukomys damarensis]